MNPTDVYNDMCKTIIENDDPYCFLLLFDMFAGSEFTDDQFYRLMKLHELAYQELQGTL